MDLIDTYVRIHIHTCMPKPYSFDCFITHDSIKANTYRHTYMHTYIYTMTESIHK